MHRTHKVIRSRTALICAGLCAATSLAAAQFQLRTPPVAMNAPDPLGQPDFDPSVAGDGAGNWIAIWGTLSFGGSHILAARSADNGATWSATVQLDPNVAVSDGFVQTIPPTVATDGLGVWIAIWSMDTDANPFDRDTFVSRSTDNGATWSDPVVLNTPAQGADVFNIPHIATDRAGNWVAVFTGASATDPADDLYFARSNDNGLTWSAAALLDDNPNKPLWDWYPRVATDGAGNWIAVWGTRNDLAGGTIDEFKIVSARSTDNGATWTDPAFLSTTTMNDYRPNIATDGANNWVVVWVTADDEVPMSDFMVSRSADDGVTWTPSMPVGPLGTTSDQSFLATDSAGNWIATWQIANNGAVASANAVSRSSDNGATWTAPERLAANSLGTRPCLASDGVGNWIAAWSHMTESNFDANEIVYTRWGGILAPDRDGDNLSDGAETTAGTSSNLWDTDGDTLSDADEVNVHNTSPLLDDTDGDGVWDGIEIALGTDPLDPFDFPLLPLSWKWLAAALTLAAGIAAIRRTQRRHLSCDGAPR